MRNNVWSRCVPGAVCLAMFAALFSGPAAAQQKVPFRNNIPVAPSGLEIPPLPDNKTAEGQDIRAVVLTRGLERLVGNKGRSVFSDTGADSGAE